MVYLFAFCKEGPTLLDKASLCPYYLQPFINSYWSITIVNILKPLCSFLRMTANHEEYFRPHTVYTSRFALSIKNEINIVL